MLWRDGEWLHYEYDWVNTLSVPISQIGKLEREIWDWFFIEVANSDPTIHTATGAAIKASDLYQSFLLDYIEYLIDDAIDKQLVLDTSLRRVLWNAEQGQITDVIFCHYTNEEFAEMLGGLHA